MNNDTIAPPFVVYDPLPLQASPIFLRSVVGGRSAYQTDEFRRSGLSCNISFVRSFFGRGNPKHYQRQKRSALLSHQVELSCGGMISFISPSRWSANFNALLMTASGLFHSRSTERKYSRQRLPISVRWIMHSSFAMPIVSWWSVPGLPPKLSSQNGIKSNLWCLLPMTLCNYKHRRYYCEGL